MFYIRSFIVALLLVITFSTGSSHADTLTRGPYIQRTSQSATIIRWRSSDSVVGTVKYGNSLNNLDQSLSEGSATTEHRLELTGLNAGTKYFYQIGSAAQSLTPLDDNYYFVTNPSGQQDTRVWVLGDSGRGNADALMVKQSYLNYLANSNRKADLWLMLGDNAYNNGLDNEYQTGLFDVYPEILKNTVLWPTLGNHDGYAKNFVSGEIPYYSSFSLPRNAEVGGVASGTESYYSFDYSNIHFICLNAYDEPRASTAAMATWLKTDIATSSKTWKIAFWHHPPYSKGTHDSDTEIELIEMREQILPILEDNGIDLVLTGHSHNYERSYLVDSHYGNSSTFSESMKVSETSGLPAYFKPPQNVSHYGTVYVVNGTGSNVGGGALNHPVFYTTKSELGSMILDITERKLNAQFINSSGQVSDSFAIDKSGQSAAAQLLKNDLGLLQGSVEELTSVNNVSQKLVLKSRRGSTKVSARSVYTFDVPSHFHNSYLNISAFKDSKSSPNFNLQTSSDGKTFKKLTSISSLKVDNQALKFALGSVANSKVYVQISANARIEKKNRKLIIDQLSISNE